MLKKLAIDTETVEMSIVVQTSAIDAYNASNIDTNDNLHPSHFHHLAAQVLHNLQYQHDWTELRLHTRLEQTPDGKSGKLPRPIVSGIPPRPVYIHPDQQIELIKKGIKDHEAELEREWILPSHLRERWTLRRFAEIFDVIENVPPGPDGRSPPPHQWRQTKRLLLATVDDDSTITYYIVHDGIVKPRQN